MTYKKIIIFFVFLFSGITNADVVKDNQSNFKIPKQIVYSNNTMECPQVISGYITRVHHYDYAAGKTYCNVYKIDPNTGIVSDQPQKTPDGASDVIVDNYNPVAQSYYTSLTPSERKSVDSQLDKDFDDIGKDIVNGNEFKQLETLYLKDYTKLDNGDKFLTGAKYLVAGLTMDGEIIDIPASLQTNEIALKKGYTIYPNATVSKKGEVSGLVSKFTNFLSDYTFYSKTEKQKIEAATGTNITLASTSKNMLDNVMVFVIDFFASINENYGEINFMVLALSAMFTTIFWSQQKLTKRISKMQDHDDPWERLFLGVIIILVFYISQTTYNVNNDRKIDQTFFQNSSRWLIYKGIDWADSATRSMASAYVSFKLKDTGILSKEQVKTLKYAKSINERKQNELTAAVAECEEYYDVAALGLIAGNKQGVYSAFPETDLQEKAFLKPEYKNKVREAGGAKILSSIPRLSSCRNSLRELTLVSNAITQQQYKLDDYKDIMSGDKIKNRMLLVTENIYKITADQGFIAAPAIATTDFFLDMSEVLDTEAKQEAKDAANTDNASESITEDEMTIVPNGLTAYVGEKIAYMIVPGASSIQSSLYQLKDQILGNEKYRTKGETVETEKHKTPLAETAWILITFIITIVVVKSFITYLPILALLISSLLAIVFYFLTIELFYIVTPFVVAYALTSDQQKTLISLLTRYFALALKPVLIVFSIVVAMLIVSLFEGINGVVVEPLFKTFQTVLNVVDSSMINNAKSFVEDIANWNLLDAFGITHIFNELIVGFIGGIASVTTKIFAVFAVFYIVFNGSDMMLKLFGLKENGIDVQEGIGGQIESGMGRYSKPI